MSSARHPCFFSPTESRELGEAVAHAAGLQLAALEERSFDGGEFKLRPLESVRGRDAFVLQTLAEDAACSLAQRFVRLLFLLGGLRDAGAERRVAVLPYLAYARKDRRTQSRDPVHTRYVAELLEAAGATRLVAVDAHNPAALDNAFRIPVDHLSALPMFADHFARRLGGAPAAVASPDVGGIKRAQIFRELLARRTGREVELVFVEKRRAGGIVSGGTLVGLAQRDATIIVIDDLCATGRTLIRAAQACRATGVGAVHVAVTHLPSSAGLQALTAAPEIAGVVATDSVGTTAWQGNGSDQAGKLTLLPIASLLGAALRRMLAGEPLAPLLSEWPLPAEH